MYVCTNSTIIIIISFHFIHTYTIFYPMQKCEPSATARTLCARGVLNTFDVSYSHLLMKPKRYNMQTQSQSKTDDRPFEDKKKINTYSLVCSTIRKNRRKYKKKKKRRAGRSKLERAGEREIESVGCCERALALARPSIRAAFTNMCACV